MNIECNVCECKMNSLLNLNSHPFNSKYTKYCNFLDYNPLHINNESNYPLHLYYCINCYHIQLDYNIPHEYIENIENSFISKEIVIYFILRLYNLNLNVNFDKINILHVGTKNNIIELLLNDINLHTNITSCITFDCLDLKKNSTFDIIILENHCNMNNIKYLMNENSILFINSPILLNTRNNVNIISHDNLNYYNTNSMNLICAKNNLILNSVVNNSIFEITLRKTADSNIIQSLFNEEKLGFYINKTYLNYELNILNYKNNFHNKLIGYKLENKRILGIGSNSNTLLNMCNINYNIIDYIINTDTDTDYVNLHTPKSNLLLFDIKTINKITKDTIIVTFDNYKKVFITFTELRKA